jgi:hypothetical protein
MRQWRKDNKAKINADQRRRYADNPDRQRMYHRRYKYGLEPEDFNALLLFQGRKCGLCGTRRPGTKHGQWCVDHDHKTGKVRGLLCKRCNSAIGLLDDDLGRVDKAKSYLKNPPAKRLGV